MQMHQKLYVIRIRGTHNYLTIGTEETFVNSLSSHTEMWKDGALAINKTRKLVVEQGMAPEAIEVVPIMVIAPCQSKGEL